MSKAVVSLSFQALIEAIETLPLEDQALLIEIVRKRLSQQRRAELAAEVAEVRDAYQRGDVRCGAAADLMRDLEGGRDSTADYG